MIRLPLLMPASTTSTLRASAAMRRLRRGNSDAWGGVPSGNSDSRLMRWAKARFSGG